MRREDFTLDVSNIDWVDGDGSPSQPHVLISVSGTAEQLTTRLTDSDGSLLSAEETDVAFRLQEPLERNADASGVVGVTNRITGEFILELNEEATDVLRFIRAAREYGATTDDDGKYRVDITVNDETLVRYEKSTLLVYDTDGNLLRSKSLIPSGIEL
ncbi:MAG: DUF5793 family protein [Halobacteriota archaeon]